MLFHDTLSYLSFLSGTVYWIFLFSRRKIIFFLINVHLSTTNLQFLQQWLFTQTIEWTPQNLIQSPSYHLRGDDQTRVEVSIKEYDDWEWTIVHSLQKNFEIVEYFTVCYLTINLWKLKENVISKILNNSLFISPLQFAVSILWRQFHRQAQTNIHSLKRIRNKFMGCRLRYYHYRSICVCPFEKPQRIEKKNGMYYMIVQAWIEFIAQNLQFVTLFSTLNHFR